jgi:hypothetical protein
MLGSNSCSNLVRALLGRPVSASVAVEGDEAILGEKAQWIIGLVQENALEVAALATEGGVNERRQR